MSNNATGWQTIPPAEAWPLESRKQMMRDVVTIIASKNALRLVNAPAIARTYNVPENLVEAEMMKHLSEGDGK